MHYLLLIVGIVLLVKGADYMIDGAVELATIFGFSALFIGLSFLAFRTRKNLNTMTLFLNVCILSLFLLSVGKVILFHTIPIKTPTPDHALIDTLPRADAVQKEDLPDIYYLIFDFHWRDRCW